MSGELVVIEADELDRRIEAAVRRVIADQQPAAEWVDTAGAAALRGEHPKTTARRARAGEIPARRLGRSWRFKRSDVIASIERGGA